MIIYILKQRTSVKSPGRYTYMQHAKIYGTMPYAAETIFPVQSYRCKQGQLKYSV
jgi:hypothetical protein